MFRQLLVPMDGSDLADGTIHRAVSFARALGAGITLAHPQESFFVHSEAGPYGEALSLGPSVAVQVRHAEENATESVLARIFMASHGRRGMAGLLLGSETQRVLVLSSLPVPVYRMGERPCTATP
jgi:nucleotide-binding universal stress UspA family protein